MTQPTITINYSLYLHGKEWPSDSQRLSTGSPSPQPVTEMPPQQAAACLAKLVRWCWRSPIGDMASIDLDSREEYIRKSNLGIALAARALGLENPETIYALYSDATDLPGQSVTIQQLIGDIFSVLVETNPVANQQDLARIGAEISGDLFGRYKIIPT